LHRNRTGADAAVVAGRGLAVPLDLEQSYEQACHDLWIV
jgi:hypothetical protein